MSIDIQSVRQQFPSLHRKAIFFDNPGGTQIAKPSLDRMVAYLSETNANHGGLFATSMAHAAGALVYVDAVHYAPHGSIDVQDLDCDFLVCSAYKFFGPHVGMLYGKYELLDQLSAYKVRPAPDTPPGKFQTGTPNFEGIAGVLGSLEYLEWLGEKFGPANTNTIAFNRTQRFKQAMTAITDYERQLSQAMLEILEETPGVVIYGLTSLEQLHQRVPTFAFTLAGKSPQQVAAALGKRDIFVWDGNYYALLVTESLGLEDTGGMVRVGPVHYNTMAEIQQFGEVLREIAGA